MHGLWSLIAAISAAVATSQAPPPITEAQQKRYSLPELVKQVSPGIVHVASLNRQGKVGMLGSGFVADGSGLIVTCYHLLRGADGAMVKTSDGEVYDRVEVIEYDIRRDLIILKIRPFSALHPLRLTPADQLDLGEDVAAVGNPQGLENSVSSGIVAGHRQAQGYRLIQTTAPVSPGSSGSPLLNMHGEVVGLISAQIAPDKAQNLNFAVPTAYITPLLTSASTPVSIAEFTRRVAESPTAGLLAGGPMRASGAPEESAWRVVHDHKGFSDTCTGDLRIVGDSLAFQSSADLAESWSIHLWQVASAQVNSVYGSRDYAFHIRLKDDRNYNFKVLTPEGEAGNPTAFLQALKRARERAVKRR